jgi:hypothetical protein
MVIYDSSLATARGLRVGSPARLVDSLYYNEHEFIHPGEEFYRLGPYDPFTEYSSWIMYSSGDHCFVVFFDHDRVVKLLFYIGIQE